MLWKTSVWKGPMFASNPTFTLCLILHNICLVPIQSLQCRRLYFTNNLLNMGAHYKRDTSFSFSYHLIWIFTITGKSKLFHSCLTHQESKLVEKLLNSNNIQLPVCLFFVILDWKINLCQTYHVCEKSFFFFTFLFINSWPNCQICSEDNFCFICFFISLLGLCWKSTT